MTVMSAAHGRDIWYGMKGASAPFLGARAMTPGFDLAAVVIGIVAHLGISAAWGAGFGVLAHGLGKLATMAASAAWGVVVWLGMYYAVLPLVGLSAMRADAPPARAVAFHIVFGLLLGGALLLHRYASERPSMPAWWRRGIRTPAPVSARWN